MRLDFEVTGLMAIGLGVIAVAIGFVARAEGGLVTFEVPENPRSQVHHDSFVLPLTDPSDIAHARDLIELGSARAGATRINANIAAGADGINREVFDPTGRQWSWHGTHFNGFADFGIELVDAWPGLVQSDVPGWIMKIRGRIGFWNHTVISELPPPPTPIPQPIPLARTLPIGLFMLAGVCLYHRSKCKPARIESAVCGSFFCSG